jgi:protein phosphatase 1L
LATDGFWDVVSVEELQFLIKSWEIMKNKDGLSQYLLEAA